jgi:hypothetical protein
MDEWSKWKPPIPDDHYFDFGHDRYFDEHAFVLAPATGKRYVGWLIGAVAIAAILFGLAGLCCGAEPAGISISGPADPVPVGKPVKLAIGGVGLQEFIAGVPKRAIVVNHFPRRDVELDGQFDLLTAGVLLRFEAARPGEYLVEVSRHTAAGIDRAEIVLVVIGELPTPPKPPTPPPTPDPDQNPHKPSDTWRPKVEPVLKVRLSRGDASVLAAMYAATAADVRAGKIGTTAELRKTLIERGTPLGLKGRYPELPAAIEGVLVGVFTVEVQALEPGPAADLLATLAWAIWEAGK